MISIIFPVRNEFPQIIWTVYSLVNDVEQYDDFEVLLVENGCNQKNLDFLEWFNKCRMARKGHLKLLHSEPGVWPALRKGFSEAKGDLLVWGCSHITVRNGSIPAMAELVRREGGICHSPMLWMGDYTNKREDFKSKLYSYKDPILRGWSWSKPWTDKPFTVASMGGGFSVASREEHEKWGLIEPNMTIISGGETYMDLKWWLLGSKVWVHPDSMYYHWAYNRGWRGDELTKETVKKGTNASMWASWNKFVALWCLGGDEWITRVYGDIIENSKLSKLFQEYMEKIRVDCKPTRDFILKNQVYDGLTDLLTKQPWDHPKMDKYSYLEKWN